MYRKFRIMIIMLLISFILVGCNENAPQADIEGYQILLIDDNKDIIESYYTTDLDIIFALSNYIPIKEGYSFSMWNQLIAENNLKIYQAVFDINTYTISFEINGGSSVEDLTLDFHEDIPEIENPTKAGSYFSGWYLDTDFSQLFSLEQMPSNDLTLYAKWESSPFLYQLDRDDNAIIYGILPEYVTSTLVIPEQIDGHDVISINEDAFSGCSKIIDLTIPNSVLYLPQALLKDLTKLETLTTPFVGEQRDATIGRGYLSFFFYTDEITSFHDINRQASYIPETLKTIILTDSTTIHSFAFAATLVENVVLNDGLTTIESSAFFGSNIGLVEIPASVIDIDPSAFVAMTKLFSIAVDQDNPVYSSGLFGHGLFNKDKTELISYPGGLNSLEYSIPDTVIKIGRSAFEGNTKLVRVLIPDRVTEIGTSAFPHTTNLTTVEFAENSELEMILEGAFYQSSIIYITIPSTVEYIGRLAFAEATKLESVVFANESQLSHIDSQAFYGTQSLHEIIIPISVTMMDALVFGSIYTNLTIYVEATSEPQNWIGWYSSRDLITIVWDYLSNQ